MIRLLALLVLMPLFAGCAAMPPPPPAASGHFVARTLEIENRTFRYQVFVPARHAPQGTPIVLFLHGSGERGSDGERPLLAGLGPWLRANADTFPALAVFPQVPENEEWLGRNARMAVAALDAASREFGADPRRTYLTGMSMGGYGTWEVALMHPHRFAALVPICGGLSIPRPERPTLRVDQVTGEADPHAAVVARLHDVPTWIFHGARDDIVPPDDDRRLHRAALAAGADFRYTEYPDVGHNAWDPAYRDPAMWQWLFQQRR